jgi:DNA-binding CsgD family transcriptional regulator
MHGSEDSIVMRTSGRNVLDDDEWVAVARKLRLSTRERQIVKRLFDDDSEAVIADDLGISPHTVHTHLERLYHKLGVGSRCAVVVRVFAAYRAGCASRGSARSSDVGR